MKPWLPGWATPGNCRRQTDVFNWGEEQYSFRIIGWLKIFRYFPAGIDRQYAWDNRDTTTSW